MATHNIPDISATKFDDLIHSVEDKSILGDEYGTAPELVTGTEFQAGAPVKYNDSIYESDTDEAFTPESIIDNEDGTITATTSTGSTLLSKFIGASQYFVASLLQCKDVTHRDALKTSWRAKWLIRLFGSGSVSFTAQRYYEDGDLVDGLHYAAYMEGDQPADITDWTYGNFKSDDGFYWVLTTERLTPESFGIICDWKGTMPAEPLTASGIGVEDFETTSGTVNTDSVTAMCDYVNTNHGTEVQGANLKFISGVPIDINYARMSGNCLVFFDADSLDDDEDCVILGGSSIQHRLRWEWGVIPNDAGRDGIVLNGYGRAEHGTVTPSIIWQPKRDGLSLTPSDTAPALENFEITPNVQRPGRHGIAVMITNSQFYANKITWNNVEVRGAGRLEIGYDYYHYVGITGAGAVTKAAEHVWINPQFDANTDNGVYHGVHAMYYDCVDGYTGAVGNFIMLSPTFEDVHSKDSFFDTAIGFSDNIQKVTGINILSGTWEDYKGIIDPDDITGVGMMTTGGSENRSFIKWGNEGYGAQENAIYWGDSLQLRPHPSYSDRLQVIGDFEAKTLIATDGIPADDNPPVAGVLTAHVGLNDIKVNANITSIVLPAATAGDEVQLLFRPQGAGYAVAGWGSDVVGVSDYTITQGWGYDLITLVYVATRGQWIEKSRAINLT